MWLLIASVALSLFLLVVILILWTGRRRRGAGTARATAVPRDIRLTAQPLLSQGEAAFYNVLRLAVQDEYLVFAQVPLWCLIEATSPTAKLRQALIGQMALKRLDFVLVHPGNLMAVKVIELEEADPAASRRARNQFVDTILTAAGIEILRLPAADSYTIPSVAALLEIEQPE
jgi:hypothetical protein